MNDASGDQRMYTRLERKARLCRSIRPFAPVTSSSSPGRSPRIPTERFAAFDDAWAFLQAVMAATSRNRARYISALLRRTPHLPSRRDGVRQSDFARKPLAAVITAGR